jgi:hypothetical protein
MNQGFDPSPSQGTICLQSVGSNRTIVSLKNSFVSLVAGFGSLRWLEQL